MSPMELLPVLDLLADGKDFEVEPEMRALVWDRFDKARRFEEYQDAFQDYCADWADLIRGEQHDDTARHEEEVRF